MSSRTSFTGLVVSGRSFVSVLTPSLMSGSLGKDLLSYPTPGYSGPPTRNPTRRWRRDRGRSAGSNVWSKFWSTGVVRTGSLLTSRLVERKEVGRVLGVWRGAPSTVGFVKSSSTRYLSSRTKEVPSYLTLCIRTNGTPPLLPSYPLYFIKMHFRLVFLGTVEKDLTSVLVLKL